MKKHLSILLTLTLALALVMSLTACGGNGATESDPPETESLAESSAPELPDVPIAEEVKGVTIPAFSIFLNGVEVTNETMAAYPVYSVQSVSINSSGTETVATYVGFKLADVLEAAGLTDEYIWLQAIADDGYAVTLTGDILSEDTTLIAVSKDGSPFGSGPWFAPCSSGTSGEYLKGMVNLLVNTVESAPDVVLGEAGDAGGDEGDELPEILDRTDKVEFEPFSFMINGAEITNETLEGLNIYKISSTVTDNSGATVQSDYTGYKLADVLEAAGVGEGKNVKAVANDGFESTLTAEMIESDHTLLAIEKDKELGEDGTVWVAPCAQATAGSYVKLVVELIAE